ncbi:MAG: hypothetical protein RL607_1438 [Bacteroidota bacterium]
MKEKKPNIRLQKIRKITLRILLSLLILLILLAITLSLPVVQTKIAQYFTEQLNRDYKVDIHINRVEVTVFGGVQLKEVLVKDASKDTLIFAQRIGTNVTDVKSLLDGNLYFGKMKVDGLLLDVKTKKGERDTNLDKFVAAFDDGKKASGKFRMVSKEITLVNSVFRLTDYNRKVPKDADFTKINAVISDFKIKGPNVYTHIDSMSFLDHRGLFVTELSSQFTYTKQNIRLEKTDLKTEESHFKGDVVLRYDRKDFADFNNKVRFDVNTNLASISTNDIRYFYKEMGKNNRITFSGKLDGTLNNFTAKRLYLKDRLNSEIAGNVNFRNLFATRGEGDFYMKGRFKKVSSNYEDLTALLPNVLGKKLPSSLGKLGQFLLSGDAEVTTKSIDANFELSTLLGKLSADMVMTDIDNIDNASYSGVLVMNQFDVGTFLGRNDLGKVSLNVAVDGKGFVEKYLDVHFSGGVQSIEYNGYAYQNILADGSFKKPIFKGKVNVNDPNLFFDFDGIVDLSKKENRYDFHARVDYANLKALRFLPGEVAVFRGDVVMKMTGNSLNNMKGDVVFTNASYINQKNQYFFDYLSLNSNFNANGEHEVTLYSPDEVSGKIQGKFEFEQISKMVENSLGSLYTNYRPNTVKSGQYLKFEFKEFHNIIEIINPKVTFSEDAELSGIIRSDQNDFKMDLKSKSVDVYGNHLDNVLIDIDNKNPLYNTYVQMDSIKTKYYKIRDFSLINATSKDTLSFRTEFKGGEKGNDFYNLNLYHTIDENKQNVIGFRKSEVMFKDYLWYINANEDEKHRIVFDKKLNNFKFDELVISHEDQFMKLNGGISSQGGSKDLQLTFNNVNLNKITPDVKQFVFDGKVNGEVKIKQFNSVYQPTAQLQIEDLLVNDNELGNLDLQIKGNEDFSKFDIHSTIENKMFRSFTAEGNLTTQNGATFLDLDLNFQRFNLGVLDHLGGEVLSNIRGFVSGNARLDGNINSIDYNGRLFVDDAGVTVPYLNVDYKIQPNSIVDVTQDRFIIQKARIFDSKYNTEGTIQGFVKHKQFGNWELDLNIASDKILALDTKDSDDAAYYGTAYIDGFAAIKGPTENLEINMVATSVKGTDIKIPINDADAVAENNYIHFTTPSEKKGQTTKEVEFIRDYNGLQMNFEFNITPVANIEVILNKESKHGMRGTGVGTLFMNINTLGKFEMNGDFQVWDGYYNFKYGGLIDKKFKVKRYGSIVWDGNPYRAQLNLEAVSQNITANPAVLIENASFNRKIPVEVVISLKGTVLTPEPDFAINFPNVSSVIRSEIETKLSDKDTRQTQALYLLSTGGFLSPEGLSQSQITNSFYEKAGALFGDLFNDKDGKFIVDVTYSQADRTALNPTDGRLVANITTQINDRITINGKVGVPTGGVSQTAIVGNFEALYRVNEDGTLNLRLFNRENDINYIGQGVGYTQGAGISYEVDFDTFNELVKKIFGKKAVQVSTVGHDVPEDSGYLPDHIDMNSKPENKKPDAPPPSPNRDAIPQDD